MKINYDELQRQIVSGFSPDEIHKYLTAQGVKISRQTLNRAIERAGARIRKRAAVDFEYSRGEALLRLNDLYKKSILISDYKTALAVAKEKAHLLGLQMAPESEEEEGTTGNLEDVLELNRIIEENFGHLDPDMKLTPAELIKRAAQPRKGSEA